MNRKQPGRIGMGSMRFKSGDLAAAIVRRAIDHGFNYIDTCPEYRYCSRDENAETWIGRALERPGYRERLILSSKSSPCVYGNVKDPQTNRLRGKDIHTAGLVKTIMKQSLDRLNQSYFDIYHMWSVHDIEAFEAALSPGNWLDGVMEQKDKWRSLGITTHAESQTVIRFLETRLFDYVTIPLNVINRTRLDVVRYCREKGIRVFAMNSFAGGLLARDETLRELALSYLLSLEGVCALIGFNVPEEVDDAKRILDRFQENPSTSEEIMEKVAETAQVPLEHCTSCGYCSPCPEGIILGACLSYFNMYKYFKNEDSRTEFLSRQWDRVLQLDRCVECMTCMDRCPNKLPLDRIIPEAKLALYGER